ncbi:MAG TPA: RagB/SusD family nutrient uptake outer membrane protein [Puia sp.]|nr:RagB/SusD family nutrient uptake outer membrane protein [Puia sp.]
MNKRTMIYCLLMASCFFTEVSCSKFLDKQQQGVYNTTDFYTSSDAAIQAVNAAYIQLTFTNATANPLWVFGDVASDDAVKGGQAGDNPDIGAIDNFTYNSSNANLSAEWGNFYEGITNCNLVLANIPSISMDTALRSRILGEAKFLRAWYYFMLVNIYGDVPVVLTPLLPAQLQIAQTPAQQIYESVIEPDLFAAINALPVNYTGTDVGRATSGAATALLSKVYLYQQKWDSSLIYSQKIIAGAQYSLMKIYSQNFDADHKNNSESIFEVQMLSNQAIGVGNNLNQWFAPQVDNGYFFNCPTQNFVDEFERTDSGVYDPRLDYTIGRDSMPWFNGEIFLASWSPTGYLTKKYQQPFSEVPISLKGTGSCDYLAVRYADVLLFNAEALNELGQTTAALIPLNQVRKRARESYLYDSTQAGVGVIPNGLLPDVTAIDQGSVRTAIQHERRVEFGFEFHRFFDIIRWGSTYANNALIVNSGLATFNYTTNKTFPIPQSERDADKALH